jgi:PKD repeat protein
VTGSAITGLNAVSSSPTRLTDATFFTATVNSGSNVSYQWNFGDGSIGANATVSHTYAAVGVYLVVVTATNGISTVNTSLAVTITNQAPIANAGTDQNVQVSALVTLNGSGSIDPDGHLPLAYLWQQTGGPGVVLSSAVISRPTFTAPSSPTMLTFTLRVTDTVGAGSAPATVVIHVADQAIAGLGATNDSPTSFSNVTHLTATVAAGTNVQYTWDFGDGQSGSGAQASHQYASIGSYTATVTATNSLGTMRATTIVTVIGFKLYLPLVANQSTATARRFSVYPLMVEVDQFDVASEVMTALRW